MRSWRLTVRWIADGLENDDASMRRSVGMRPPPVWKASSQEMLRRDDKQRIQILGSWRVALAAGGRASMTHGKVAQSLEMGIGQRGKALSSEDQPCEELESALAAGIADAAVVPGVGQPDTKRLAFQSAKSGKKANEFPVVGCARGLGRRRDGG